MNDSLLGEGKEGGRGKKVDQEEDEGKFIEGKGGGRKVT